MTRAETTATQNLLELMEMTVDKDSIPPFMFNWVREHIPMELRKQDQYAAEKTQGMFTKYQVAEMIRLDRIDAAEKAEVHYPASNNLNPTVNRDSILDRPLPEQLTQK